MPTGENRVAVEAGRATVVRMASEFSLDLVERPRRLRRTESVRAMVRETVVRAEDLIAPLFVVDGSPAPEEIASMPGQFRWNIKDLVKECRALAKLGVRAVAIFPKLDASLKDADGTVALDPQALVLRAVRAVKKAVPALTIITDVALDPYTTHGHDGVLTATGDDVDNDRTVDILCRMALLQAEAGVDLVAPSDMMDGESERSGRRSTTPVSRARASWPIRLNLTRPITDRFGRRWGARRPRAHDC